jgi:hypothetical protein
VRAEALVADGAGLRTSQEDTEVLMFAGATAGEPSILLPLIRNGNQ